MKNMFLLLTVLIAVFAMTPVLSMFDLEHITVTVSYKNHISSPVKEDYNKASFSVLISNGKNISKLGDFGFDLEGEGKAAIHTSCNGQTELLTVTNSSLDTIEIQFSLKLSLCRTWTGLVGTASANLCKFYFPRKGISTSMLSYIDSGKMNSIEINPEELSRGSTLRFELRIQEDPEIKGHISALHSLSLQ